MIEDLVSKVFADRHLAHLAHWKTNSYSAHMALGGFYDSVIDNLDAIVEAYQGYVALIGDVSVPSVKTGGDIIPTLSATAVWIAKNRSTIAKQNPAIENLVDTLAETYLTTIYKLKNLK